MNQERWTAVDEYFASHLLPPDPALAATLETSAAAGLPQINVSPTQGKLLQLLAQLAGAKTILEIGTLGGYSTIWLARALPANGRLISLEADARHAEVARSNIARAGLSDRVEIRIGEALDTLPKLALEKTGAFDLTFIDADKINTPAYFDWAVKLSHPGSLIVVDNVVRNGEIINSQSTDPSLLALRRLNEMIAADPRLDGTALQTVGSKGYDGLTFVRIKAPEIARNRPLN